MQLFILDADPRSAARMLCDKHLRKMCLETAQILSAVLFTQKIPLQIGMPKPYNPHHPVIMALNTGAKINWVVLYNSALHREYKYRFDKDHAYKTLSGQYIQLLYQPDVPCGDLSFALAFKEFTSQSSDPVKAYREYYCHKKKLLCNFVYTRRLAPNWLI